MTEKAKENEVSRRDFIKDLGGGAIGAAIISTQLLAPRPVNAAGSDKVKVFVDMKKGDLGGRWDKIREQTTLILNSLSSSVGAMQVNWRLNVSGEVRPAPVFIDWVGTETVKKILEDKNGVKIADLGERRLGDGVPSSVYNQGLKDVANAVVVRDWNCDLLLKEKKVDSRLLVPKAGLMHQRFIGIIAQEPGKRCVGLLTVSFKGKPSNPVAVDDEMKKLASWPNYPKSLFVKYIEDNFVLGGPIIK